MTDERTQKIIEELSREWVTWTRPLDDVVDDGQIIEDMNSFTA